MSNLQIPYLTLLDLDVARYAAGWGRIKVVNDQLAKFEPAKVLPEDWGLPKWNATEAPVRTHHCFGDDKKSVFCELERRGVYFSEPLDLDFAMLFAFPEAYGVERDEPDEGTIKAILGKKHHDANQYKKNELELFNTYHQRFKLGSKPAAHIDALAQLTDKKLLAGMPASLSRLADAVIAKLKELPE